MTDLQGNDNTITNRFEIVFLYDVEDGNPNGDPVNENRPRIDQETGENLVTDVRLKRTVRDYLDDRYDDKTSNIFVKAEEKDDGTLMSRAEMVKQGLNEDDIPDDKNKVISVLTEHFIDLRLFGATLSVENHSIGLTGPVQFKMGRSMHEVDTRYIQQSVTIPSDEGKEQGTFADRYDLPYSLIRFYGVANENAADDTGLTYADIHTLADGLWNGTKSLITHSKMAHMPRMLLMVEYSEDDYHIGGLDRKLDLVRKDEDLDETAIRSFEQVDIDLARLETVLDGHSDKIAAVHTVGVPELDAEGVKQNRLDLE